MNLSRVRVDEIAVLEQFSKQSSKRLQTREAKVKMLEKVIAVRQGQMQRMDTLVRETKERRKQERQGRRSERRMLAESSNLEKVLKDHPLMMHSKVFCLDDYLGPEDDLHWTLLSGGSSRLRPSREYRDSEMLQAIDGNQRSATATDRERSILGIKRELSDESEGNEVIHENSVLRKKSRMEGASLQSDD